MTKKQIMYGGVLVVAAGAFLWDRNSSPSTPAPAEGAAAALSPSPTPSAAASQPARANSNTFGRENVGARLKGVAAARQIELAHAPDAFAVPADWLPKQAVAAAKPSNNQEDLDAARAFAEKHSLNAVMVRPHNAGYAIIDGQGVFVGSPLGKYKLLAVTKETAVFGRDAIRVELRLGEKPRVWREGADSAGPEGDNTNTARTE